MNKAQTYDSGAFLSPQFSSISTATAGGAGDNSAVTGESIDRQGFGSGTLAVAYKAVLSQAATLSLTVTRQDSDDGTTWNDAETLHAAAVVATGETGGSTEQSVLKVKDSYEVKARYVRYVITPNLSAANTDTASVSAVLVLGGPYNGTSLPIE